MAATEAASKQLAAILRKPPDVVSADEIMTVIKANIPAVKACVDDQRSRDAALHGKLVMRWHIAPAGGARDIEVLSKELAEAPIAKCIAKEIAGWKFPAHAAEGSEVRFPFKF